MIFIPENAFEKVVCKMSAILFRHQCVDNPGDKITIQVPPLGVLAPGASNREDTVLTGFWPRSRLNLKTVFPRYGDSHVL